MKPTRPAGVCTGCGGEPSDPALTWDDGAVFCPECLAHFRTPARPQEEVDREDLRRANALKWREEGATYREIGERLVEHRIDSDNIQRRRQNAGDAASQ